MSTELVPATSTSRPVPTFASGPGPSLVESWLAGKKPTTVRDYAGDLLQFSRWLGTASPAVALDDLLSLGSGDANGLVLRWRNAMIDGGLSSSTINRRLAAIRSVTKLGRTLGRITWVIEVEGVEHEARRDSRGPNPDEMKRVNRALKALGDGAKGRRNRAIVALLFGLGLRRAEAVGLDLADVDWPTNTVKVLGKGCREKIAREMPAPVAKAVSDWVVLRGSHPGPLFHRVDRPGVDRLDLASVNRLVSAIGNAAEMPGKLRPHGFRHAAITELFRRKKTVAQVMGFSRHANPQTVMRYHDALGDDAAEMAREVAKGLG
jgi:integrase/recombinase XerC